MKSSERQMILTEYFSLPPRHHDTGLALIETALFLEQTFGIPFSDDAISNESLGSHDLIRRLVGTSRAEP